MTPGVSISNSEVGLASLSMAAFVLRLICTNGMISKTEVSASYRHVSLKILNEFPKVLDNVSLELGKQRIYLGFLERARWKTHCSHLKVSIASFN